MDPLRIESVIEANSTAIGLAIIITNDYKSNPHHLDLLATESDGIAMEDAFKQLGFATIRKHNVTKSLVIALLHQCSSVRYPQTCKRLAFVFAGHGREPKQEDDEEGTQLVTCEGKNVSVKTVVTKLSPLSPDSTLGSMARMFFIDACRGSRVDFGRLVSRGAEKLSHRGGGVIPDIRIPSEACNFILCFSTVSGYRSYEVQKGDTGSRGIWLPLVAQKLKTSEKNIEVVMTEVNKEMMQQFQDRETYSCMMQPEMILRLNETVNLMNEYKLTDGPTLNTSSLQTEPSSSSLLPSSNLSRTPSHTSHETLPLTTQQLPVEYQQVEQSPKSKIAAIFPGQAASGSCALEHQRYLMSSPSMCLPYQSLPVAYNQATVSATPGGLVHRQSDTHVDSGHYRGILNQYCQKCVINPSYTSSWKHDETYDAKSQRKVYKATVKCILFNGQIIQGDSKQYYDGKKSIAQEQAAKDAIEQIEHVLKSSMPQNTPTSPAISLSLNPPLQTSNISQSIPSSSNPPSNIYKQELNNYFQGQLRKELPTYKSEAVVGGFQCYVSHPYFQTLFGKDNFVGKVGATKKEAENSAAWRAWTNIMPRR